MWREYPFFYGISDNPDAELFKKQCVAIEKNIPDLKSKPLLEDVDGSSIQIYTHKNGEIKVCNDYCLGDLYVESDFDLLPYFKGTAND